MPFEYRSEALQRTLAELHREAPAVRGSAVITEDGLVIAAWPPGWDGDIHDPIGGDNVAAMAAVAAGLAERTLSRLAQGELQRLLMEGSHGTLAVVPASHDAALALLVEKDARLGVVLHLARLTVEKITHILDKPA
jgi:predicted regulator of Ras-like GTPase activity (Roadblock/LC7/MglB family)